ncbi:MAG: UDP-3-O-(3-hydroxymyristoyl)glucosamine N-acyltransferase [Phycisphaerales bacterium]|nr:UDP-3-O-(3-hydroxymyristoyl)glucosamine N-acyltransferase [Phycisphaerales bacterium]
MQRTLSDLCTILRKYGMQPELVGRDDATVRGIATLEDATDGDVSFLANPKYERFLASTRANTVVVKPDVAAPSHLTLIRVADPYAAITALIVDMYGYRKHARPAVEPCNASISPSAEIGESATIHAGATIASEARIGRNAVIYPGVYIGPRCRIGDDVVLYPNVVIYEDSILGSRVTIHAGTVVGEDGLGYAPVNGRWVKIPQIGIVEIGDDVEIGSNCSIDRATLGRTRIAAGTKMSNLIAIGHGAQIGEHCLFVAQVGIAGSVHVGDHVTMAGQAGVVGHVRIGDRVTVGAKAGVVNHVSDGVTVLGAPAVPIAEAKRQFFYIARLPEMSEKIRKLEKRISELESQLKAPIAPD